MDSAPLVIAVLVFVLLVAYLWFNRAVVYLGSANRAWRRGDEPATLAFFLKAEATGHLGAEPLATLAYLLLKAGRTDEAGAFLDNALAGGPRKKLPKEPDRRLLETYRSLVLWKQKKTLEAVAVLEALLAQTYRTQTLYGNLGFFLLETGDLFRAEAVCLEAVEWEPEGKVLLDNLGALYLAKQDWPRAAETYAKLLALNPRFPEAWYGAGLAAAKTANPAEARRCWTEALNLTYHSLTTVPKKTVEDALASLGAVSSEVSNEPR